MRATSRMSAANTSHNNGLEQVIPKRSFLNSIMFYFILSSTPYPTACSRFPFSKILLIILIILWSLELPTTYLPFFPATFIATLLIAFLPSYPPYAPASIPTYLMTGLSAYPYMSNTILRALATPTATASIKIRCSLSSASITSRTSKALA